ncbi:MAG: Holliday junction branch migration protein RuvA [Calditerrivibrio sp.]|nr:Holliday junction branch migration protein RuvA [Calditerrivibrio sp.]
MKKVSFMIARLKGKLVEKYPDRIILDVNNIYFEIFITLKCYSGLPEVNYEVTIPTQTVVREDGITIYGFLNEEEKKLFGLLNTVSKIGPKIALSILSSIDVDVLKRAIKERDIGSIAISPGVGKKTAERIILELRDKVDEVEVFSSDLLDNDSDLVSALINFGYKRGDALAVIKKIDPSYKTLQDRLREALRLLNQ